MKLIKINEEHYIVVDDSEIKEGEHYINIEPSNPFFGKIYKGVDQILKEGYSGNGYKTPDYFKTWMKKITHSTQPLEKFTYDNLSDEVFMDYHNIKPISLQEIKELIGEVDVEKRIYDTDFRGDVNSYKQGYNQALEDNKEKKYTEEDLLNAFREGTNAGALHERLCDYDNGDYKDAEQYSEQYEESFIQSIQPKTQWEVEIVDGKLKLK